MNSEQVIHNLTQLHSLYKQLQHTTANNKPQLKKFQSTTASTNATFLSSSHSAVLALLTKHATLNIATPAAPNALQLKSSDWNLILDYLADLLITRNQLTLCASATNATGTKTNTNTHNGTTINADRDSHWRSALYYPLTQSICRLFSPLISTLVAHLCTRLYYKFTSTTTTTAASTAAYDFLYCSSILAHVSSEFSSVTHSLVHFFTQLPQFSIFTALTTNSPTATPTHTTKTTNPPTVDEISLLTASTCYFFLSSSLSLFRVQWNYTPIYSLLTHSDSLTRLYSGLSVNLLLGLNTYTQSVFLRNLDIESEAESFESERKLVAEQMKTVVFVHAAENAKREIDSGSSSISSSSSTEAGGVKQEKNDVGMSDSASAGSSASQQSNIWESSILARIAGVTVPKRHGYVTATNNATSPSITLTTTTTITPPDFDSLLRSFQHHTFIPTSSSYSNLRSLALSINTEKPVLLEGPVGSGKTSLIQYVAELTMNTPHLIVLHLDDQIDSKTLLGGYSITDVAGEFKWLPGAITTAVMQGKWLVIEDVDRCNFELLSSLLPLFTTRTLYIPGRNDVIQAHTQFRLFATITNNSISTNVSSGTSSSNSSSSPIHALLYSLFMRVFIPKLSLVELNTIIAGLFPVLSPTLTDRILTIFQLFYQDQTTPTTSTTTTPSATATAGSITSTAVHPLINYHSLSRKVTTRDLFQLCKRISLVLIDHTTATTVYSSYGSSLQESIFQCCVEVFVSFIPTNSAAKQALRNQLIHAIGEILLLSKERTQYYIEHYKPVIHATGTTCITTITSTTSTSTINNTDSTPTQHVTIGRSRLRRQPLTEFHTDSQLAEIHRSIQQFAVTKHSSRLLELLSVSVALSEPVLLVSETGNGKTTIIQYLANLTRNKLLVLNLNQQSDSSDLLGGYKPVDMSRTLMTVINQFGILFPKTFSRKANEQFLVALKKQTELKNWKNVVKLISQTMESVKKKFKFYISTSTGGDSSGRENEETQNKRQADTTLDSTAQSKADRLRQQWILFDQQLQSIRKQLFSSSSSTSFLFSFIEGALTVALKYGYWLLLDEINLASNEMLERLSGILENRKLTMTERGAIQTELTHSNFRIFAAMNPSGDAGKKELAPAIRAKFAEIYVPECEEKSDLLVIVQNYLVGTSSANSVSASQMKSMNFESIVDLYLQLKQLSHSTLIDGNNQHVIYSLRTLCRALQYTKQQQHIMTYDRALYEAFVMAFCSPLKDESADKVKPLLLKYFNFNPSSSAGKQIIKAQSSPQPSDQYVLLEGFYLRKGQFPVAEQSNYIITASVKARLKQLARVIANQNRYPVLLQGPTSAGKTSLVEYLAGCLGHRFVRINNHEHTDLSEYMGNYCSDSSGKLVFQEGVLVEAVRNGYWICLDELNLAPSEVLEALNRLLDDNRELYIHETQTTVKPHPNFALFATQNPPGLYGGRKVLSKAFRNRFIEFHLEDLPENELIDILHQRCHLPPSYCEKMISIMHTLQTRREKQHIFAGKRGFITPRDLFRWGERSPSSWLELAEQGFMLLGERLRTSEAKSVVKSVLEEKCKVKIDEKKMFSMSAVEQSVMDLQQLWIKYAEEKEGKDSEMNSAASTSTSSSSTASKKSKEKVALAAISAAHSNAAAVLHCPELKHIAWTSNMRRMFILSAECLMHQEPVLLVGETGAGKTSVCEVVSVLLKQTLHIINCHQHTESSDFLGGLRPVRGKEKILVQLQTELAHFFTQIKQTNFQSKTDTNSTPTNSNTDTSFTTLTYSAVDSSSILSSNSSFSIHQYMSLLESLQSELSKLQAETLKFQLKRKREVEEAAQQEKQNQLKENSKKRKKNNQGTSNAAEDEITTATTATTPTESVELESLSLVESFSLTPDQLSLFLSAIDHLNSLYSRYQSLFEWCDGALITAMQAGELILIDEISLAEDAVLERMNSVLEPSRTILLAEKSTSSGSVNETNSITAQPSFRLFATMNPGGDFGKKELSPALRNRFTEIYVSNQQSREDMMQIITERFTNSSLHEFAGLMLEFTEFYNKLMASQGHSRRILSLRDLLAWIEFLNRATVNKSENYTIRPELAYVHGVCLCLLDGLNIGTTDSENQIRYLRSQCIEKLIQQVKLKGSGRESENQELTELLQSSLAPMDLNHNNLIKNANKLQLLEPTLNTPTSTTSTADAWSMNDIYDSPTHFGIVPFLIEKGSLPSKVPPYALHSSTTKQNLLRVLRACTLQKAILLEGSPGVGKSSLIQSLAAIVGRKLIRINLSEQTDMMDLLGLDLPVNSGADKSSGEEKKDSKNSSSGGQFQFVPGVFLQALQAGDWVLLDELNLASQSVLEGLNAVLDHRASVYIPELDQTFTCPSTFRVFAAQNPMNQGGGRKGLPASFLNRFTKVYLNPLQQTDLLQIVTFCYPSVNRLLLEQMIEFNSVLYKCIMVKKQFGRAGSPWEFNLRDVFRWLDLMIQYGKVEEPEVFLNLIYVQRMRNQSDRKQLVEKFKQVFCKTNDNSPRAVVLDSQLNTVPCLSVSTHSVHCGLAHLPIQIHRSQPQSVSATSIFSSMIRKNHSLLHSILHSQKPLVENLMHCVQLNYPVLVIGSSGSGKTSMIHQLAHLTNNELHTICITAEADSSELLGCFEQVDLSRHRKLFMNKIKELVVFVVGILLQTTEPISSRGTSVAVSTSKPEKSKKRNRNTSNINAAATTDMEMEGENTSTQLSHQLKQYQDHSSSISATTSPVISAVVNLIQTLNLLEVSTNTTTSTTPTSTNSSDPRSLSTVAFTPDQHSLLLSLLSTTSSITSDHTSTNLPSHLSLTSLSTQLHHIQSLASDSSTVIGNFEWLDGELVLALEQGHWLLLENVNFCSASVLDRLNPVLERDGVLMINECGLSEGQVRIIKPHKNFRLFLTMDLQYGEVSRAMRNRCVEIVLLSSIGEYTPPTTTITTSTNTSAVISATQLDFNFNDSRDLLILINNYGLYGHFFPSLIYHFHCYFQLLSKAWSHSKLNLSVRNLILAVQLIRQQIQNLDMSTRASSSSSGSGNSSVRELVWLSLVQSYYLSLLSRTQIQFVSAQFNSLFKQLSQQEHTTNSRLLPTIYPVLDPTASAALYFLSYSLLSNTIQEGTSQDKLNTLRNMVTMSSSSSTSHSSDSGSGSSISCSTLLASLPDLVVDFVFGYSDQLPTSTITSTTSGSGLLIPPELNTLPVMEVLSRSLLYFTLTSTDSTVDARLLFLTQLAHQVGSTLSLLENYSQLEQFQTELTVHKTALIKYTQWSMSSIIISNSSSSKLRYLLFD